MTIESTLNVTTYLSSTSNTLVCWTWGEETGFLTPGAAIDQAMALINAAAIAESEACIALTLAAVTQSPLPAILGLVRAARSPMPSGLNPIYGFHTKQPLVECFWYRQRIAFTIEDARQHAQYLLGAAEAARTDNLLSSAFEDAGLNPELRERVFARFQAYRLQMEK
jgi:hypothetical protein